MIISDLLPILVLLGIGFVAIAAAIVLKIRSKKSLLRNNDQDFIDEVVEKKKRKLNANIGGITWKTYVVLLALCPIGLAAIGWLILSNKAFCIVFAFVGLFVPECIALFKAKKQKNKFEEKYAMALRALASGLRSGLSLEQAIDNVGKNVFLEPSIQNGFKQISTDIKFGIPLDEAFYNFAKESGNKDAMDVAAVISMQSKVGGSEAAVITTIVQNISNRIMMRNEIKALFADTNMLIMIMDVLPFGLIGILYLAAPNLLNPFFESLAMTLVLIGILVFTAIGSLVIHRMAKTGKGG